MAGCKTAYAKHYPFHDPTFTHSLAKPMEDLINGHDFYQMNESFRKNLNKLDIKMKRAQEKNKKFVILENSHKNAEDFTSCDMDMFIIMLCFE